MKRLVFTPEALRALDRMPVNWSRRIRNKLVQYAEDPRPFAGNIKLLAGASGLRRMRIGDWRVLFTEDIQVVQIARIAPRGSAYERL